jgi:hypothetical protein
MITEPADRGHFYLNCDLRQVLYRADAAANASAVADSGYRLVPESERDEDAVERVLQHTRQAVVVLHDSPRARLQSGPARAGPDCSIES